MVVLAETSRQLVTVELTVCWEDRMEKVTERKGARYAELSDDCCRQG